MKPLLCLLPLLAVLSAGCGRDDADPAPAAEVRAAPDCDPVRQRCMVEAGGLRMAVRMGPGVQALKTFPLRVWPELEPGTAVERFFVSFTMAGMDMGLNRYRLVAQPDGSWEAEAILPICTSGRSDWIATIELRTDRGRWKVAVPFVLAPP